MNNDNNGPKSNAVRHHGVLRDAAAAGFASRSNALVPPTQSNSKSNEGGTHQANSGFGGNTKKFRDVGKEMLADRSGKDDPFQRAANYGAGTTESQITKSTKTHNTVNNLLKVPANQNWTTGDPEDLHNNSMDKSRTYKQFTPSRESNKSQPISDANHYTQP
jgi:hypothetical protein